MANFDKKVHTLLSSSVRATPLRICCCLQVLFNYRADRMVEISKAFEYEDFDAFDRVCFPKVRVSLFGG